jgi:hypothetical protein
LLAKQLYENIVPWPTLAQLQKSASYVLLTLWILALLERPPVVRPFDSFPSFYGTRRFNAEFTGALHLFLSWARPIQSTSLHPNSKTSVLLLSTHLRLGLPSGLFPTGFPTNNLYALLFSPIRATCSTHLILLEVEVEVTLRLTVSQSACLGVGHPFGAHDQILLFPFSCRKIALLFVLGHPLWREDGSVICSAISQWSESRRTRNHTLLSHLRLLVSLSVASTRVSFHS